MYVGRGAASSSSDTPVASKLKKSELVSRGLLEARGESAETLEVIEDDLDTVALPICTSVEARLLRRVTLRSSESEKIRRRRLGRPASEADSVRYELFAAGATGDDRYCDGRLVLLARRDFDVARAPFGAKLRPDGKPFRIYEAKWITLAATPEPPARLPAGGPERLRSGSVEHFGEWQLRAHGSAERVDERVIERFVYEHLARCTCPPPCSTTVHQVRSFLRRQSPSFPTTWNRSRLGLGSPEEVTRAAVADERDRRR
jgi:hypothetical protein